MNTTCNNQLTIDLPADYSADSGYIEAKAKFEKMGRAKGQNIFLCYLSTKKSWFVSKWFSKEFIEKNYKTIKIVEE